MKRLKSVALLVAAIVLCATAAAFADNLKPVPDSPSPDAWGAASAKWLKWAYCGWGNYNYNYEAQITYSFKGLAPYTQYYLFAVMQAGWADRVAGPGTDAVGSATGVGYSSIYVDPSPKPKILYYELWAVDFNGAPTRLVLSSQ